MAVHLLNVFYLLLHVGLCDRLGLEVLQVVVVGVVCAELGCALWSAVSLLEGVVLSGFWDIGVDVALDAVVCVCVQLLVDFDVRVWN